MAEGFSAALPRHRLPHATLQALAAVGPSQGCCHSFDTSGWEAQESLLLTPIISRSHKMRSQRLAYIPKSHSHVFLRANILLNVQGGKSQGPRTPLPPMLIVEITVEHLEEATPPLAVRDIPKWLTNAAGRASSTF